jgi:hypothetical protein
MWEEVVSVHMERGMSWSGQYVSGQDLMVSYSIVLLLYIVTGLNGGDLTESYYRLRGKECLHFLSTKTLVNF